MLHEESKVVNNAWHVTQRFTMRGQTAPIVRDMQRNDPVAFRMRLIHDISVIGGSELVDSLFATMVMRCILDASVQTMGLCLPAVLAFCFSCPTLKHRPR